MDVSISHRRLSQILEEHHNSQEEQQNTQELSQETQQNTSQESATLKDGLHWGVLIPFTLELERIRFPKNQTTITIGRNRTRTVHYSLTAISDLHATITWNGEENGGSEVTITDNSRNGTYLNKKKIGRGLSRILADGNEVSFGPRKGEKNLKKTMEEFTEYRYVYHDLVSEKRAVYRKYDLSIELGSGTYAKVYKALQIGTSRWVAVKVINQVMRLNCPADKAETIREIDILGRLRHPNICAMLEYFENPNQSIDIVLEYVDGGDLSDLIARHGQLNDWLTCHITQEVCNAVVYLHSQHVTHRDLKPENILLTLQKPPIVKVADFGLAKVVDDENMSTALKTMCGTPMFMAPEIVNRLSTDKPYTDVVDSWSLGAVVFTMFTGHTLFPNVPTLELKEKIKRQEIEWSHLNNAQGITEKGKNFVEELLEFEPAYRMSVDAAQVHPWLMDHKHAYQTGYPDEVGVGQSTRTASLNSGASNPSGALPRPAPSRAVTVDPYADDCPQPPPIDNLPSVQPVNPPPPALVTERGKVGRNLRPSTNHKPPAASSSKKAPGMDSEDDFLYGRPSTTKGKQKAGPSKKVTSYVQDSTDQFLYNGQPGPAPAPVHGGASKIEGDVVRKRTFADMVIGGSLSSLTVSSVGSPSPPPKTKPRKIAKTSAEPAAPTRRNPPRGKGKKEELPGTETTERTTAVRGTTRASRPRR
ncbi:kinase-like domain-containing protein [Mycena polygramma]|nr:kinase-like domain-containing protein [Mycena polygramma]